MNKLGMFATGCLAGLVLTVTATKQPFKLLTTSALASATTSFIACLIVDTRKQSKLNDAEEKLNRLANTLAKAQSNVENSEKSLLNLSSEMVEMKKMLTIAKQSIENYQSDSEKSHSKIQELADKANSLETELNACKQELADKTTTLAEIEEHFDDIVAEEAQKQAKEYEKRRIEEVFQDHDEITLEAMGLFQELQAWSVQVRERHVTLQESTRELRRQYAKHIDEYTEKVDAERKALLYHIEVLTEKITMLEHELAQDLVQPEYGQFGYAIEGQIANHIAEWMWRMLKMPLAVKGYQVKPDGSTDVGYGFSRSVPVDALVADLNRHSGEIAKHLGIHKITNARKLEIGDLIVLTFRREPPLKEAGAKLLAGSPEEFIKYVVSHPIRYRLIADPGQGKTPTTAVMLSHILKEGCRTGNTTKGKKVPNTLVTVSYPGAQSSLKDSEYPLDQFLRYGTTTAAIKSFDDAVTDWEYRQQNLKYAKEFFQIWVWDELDNTINSATDPNKCSENLKLILKQGGHSNIGWIVSGQSVMTSQIKGFKDDDRSLFTEIIIGIPKIRMYIKKYAKGKESDANLTKLEKNLDDLESYVESVNDRITDTARLLRLALIIDDKSPKLYFLPNLDSVDFDDVFINESVNKASGMVLRLTSQTEPNETGSKFQNPYTVSIGTTEPNEPKTTMQGVAHCPHCGNSEMTFLKEQRYRCKPCNKKISLSKVVFK